MNNRSGVTRQPSLPPRQRGIVLVVGLVFLLVLTIIGVTSLRTTTLEERMAGNLQQRTVAFQDTEARIALLIDLLNSNQETLSTDDSCSGTIDPATNPDSVNTLTITDYKTCPEFLGSSNPGRLTDRAEGTQTSLFHFRIESEGTTRGHSKVELQQGVYQRGPDVSQGIVVE